MNGWTPLRPQKGSKDQMRALALPPFVRKTKGAFYSKFPCLSRCTNSTLHPLRFVASLPSLDVPVSVSGVARELATRIALAVRLASGTRRLQHHSASRIGWSIWVCKPTLQPKPPAQLSAHFDIGQARGGQHTQLLVCVDNVELLRMQVGIHSQNVIDGRAEALGDLVERVSWHH